MLLARANVALLGLAGRVTVLHGDLLEPVAGTFDLIAANLPYLPLAEAAEHPELDGDPPEARVRSRRRPRRISHPRRREPRRLRPNGTLVIQLRRRVLAATADELDDVDAVLVAA